MVLVFGDNLHRKRVSIATYVIAAACIAVTVIEISRPQAMPEIDRLFAFVPIEFSLHPAASFYTLVTAEFVHAGILHLVGNLVFLVAFGRSIENLIGSKPFLAAFVGLGALSFLGSWLLSPASPVPIIGASGALSFLMGAYTVIFPKAKLRIIPFLRVPYVRAWLFSAAWIAFQICDGLLVGEQLGGVAYATHFGGFIIGLVAGITWKEFALDTDKLIAELTDEASS
jgi:membrane associated rhomboid family serine protease